MADMILNRSQRVSFNKGKQTNVSGHNNAPYYIYSPNGVSLYLNADCSFLASPGFYANFRANMLANNEISAVNVYGYCQLLINLDNFVEMFNPAFVTNMFGAFSGGRYIYNSSSSNYIEYGVSGNPWCGPMVTNFAYAYYGCDTLNKFVCGDNVLDMSYAYTYASATSSQPAVCGNKVVNMSYAYFYVKNVTTPVCGNNVVNMHETYGYSSVTGFAVIGPNVVDMSGAYYNTSISVPACGENVRNMVQAYSMCKSLLSAPVCGNNVVNMYSAYGNSTARGEAICGPNVVDMAGAYSQCRYITKAAYCPDSVRFMGNTYGTGYLSNMNNYTDRLLSNLTDLGERPVGNYVWDLVGAFNGVRCGGDIYINGNDITDNSWFQGAKRIQGIFPMNVSVRTGRVNLWVPEGSCFHNYFNSPDVAELYSYTNSSVRQMITWTSMDNGVYNAAANIYVYFNNPHAFNYNILNTKDISHAYGASYVRDKNYNAVYRNSLVNVACGPDVENMAYAYSGCKILNTTTAVCGSKVTDFHSAYANSGVETAVIGPNVVDASFAYSNCRNLTTMTFAFGNNILNIANMYENCLNVVKGDFKHVYFMNLPYALSKTNVKCLFNGIDVDPTNVNQQFHLYVANRETFDHITNSPAYNFGPHIKSTSWTDHGWRFLNDNCAVLCNPYNQSRISMYLYTGDSVPGGE